jgi:RNA polymerase sigma factor (sigma-70 family)
MTLEELAKEPTEDLIEYINWDKQPEHKALAENAFITFCLRFRDRIQRTCWIIAENRGHDHTAAEKIAEYVFKRFLKYQKYNPKKCTLKNRDKCVELYLYRFAQRGLIDYETDLKNPFSNAQIRTEFPDVEDYFDLEEEEPTEERKAEIRKKFDIIKLALERLTPNHKTIYLTYLPYESILKKGEHYLPHEFLKQLREKTGLSQSTIKVYKNQAYNKIEEYLKIYGAK